MMLPEGGSLVVSQISRLARRSLEYYYSSIPEVHAIQFHALSLFDVSCMFFIYTEYYVFPIKVSFFLCPRRSGMNGTNGVSGLCLWCSWVQNDSLM